MLDANKQLESRLLESRQRENRPREKRQRENKPREKRPLVLKLPVWRKPLKKELA
jgi:hypothetical protein